MCEVTLQLLQHLCQYSNKRLAAEVSAVLGSDLSWLQVVVLLKKSNFRLITTVIVVTQELMHEALATKKAMVPVGR